VKSESVLQTWDAIRCLNEELVRDEIEESLGLCAQALRNAISLYDSIEATIRLDQKSNGEHLLEISEGLRIFAELAELDTAALDSE
jgi:hypothetical protein